MSLAGKERKVHFIGIGGIGMSGIAELLLNLGHKVSGSDLSSTEITKRLEKMGAIIQIGHGAQILIDQKPDVVVYSTAVPKENPERVYADLERIPLIRRAEMLAELMRLKRGIAVAGSHGKTSTTGLTSLIFKEAGLEPTVVIGGRFDALGSNAFLGKGEWLVAEADESDGSFLRLSPEFAIVTNIDREHMDHYGRFEGLLGAYEEFLDRLPFYGKAVLCSDCAHLKAMEDKLKKPRVYYGFDKTQQPDYWVELTKDKPPYEFYIYRKSDRYEVPFMKLSLPVAGRHHVLNATAAAVLSYELGVNTKAIERALSTFKGVERRFQSHGLLEGHPLIEDYAHHPTEIRATLSAAKDFFGEENKPLVIFQPHRYSRTKDLWKEFAVCFDGALEVLTLPIYAASEVREAWVEQIDGVAFADNLLGTKAQAFADRNTLKAYVMAQVKEKKIKSSTPILVLGAGDVPKIIGELKGGL